PDRAPSCVAPAIAVADFYSARVAWFGSVVDNLLIIDTAVDTGVTLNLARCLYEQEQLVEQISTHNVFRDPPLHIFWYERNAVFVNDPQKQIEVPISKSRS
ncbi:hypothetical protein, partial [Pararhizobium mangrovi]|uniref:hypothetical protein n=1 Tax=Pararhizobium mangrovi TaxID=2590452 RepID=UPI0015E830E6